MQPLVESSVRRAERALGTAEPHADPLFPTALQRGHRLLGRDPDPLEIIDGWPPGLTRETGAIRYPWPITPRFAPSLPRWVGSEPGWTGWRRRDREAIEEEPDRRRRLMDALITPLILSDVLEVLSQVGTRETPDGDRARAMLRATMPKIRRDAAAWVQEAHAWADTWALWAVARRPAALRSLHPFATAIAEAYAASAGQAGSVLGTRYPYHGVPLVSASAQLASGLVALGVHTNLVGRLASWVRTRQGPDGAWGDGDEGSDILTTFAAADLLATLDPSFDPAPTAAWLAGRQGADGWWRALGPEATWLTVEILAWLRRSDEPFARRFRWPEVALAQRDRRTGLPFYGYYADLQRLCAEVPGLASAPMEVAFVDLAGFGSFNNRFGMAAGDAALRAFAHALDRIPGFLAIRDGGDEFIVVGPPTGTGLPDAMSAFRTRWPAIFEAEFGEGTVVPRVLTTATTGRDLVGARDDLGREIANLKQRFPTVPITGVQVDSGVRVGAHPAEPT